ncbi:MAG: hypothetical protein HPY58_07820 [Firmicutes bacterium]|nr:hypothetical protein [Bacillota bacterium]
MKGSCGAAQTGGRKEIIGGMARQAPQGAARCSLQRRACAREIERQVKKINGRDDWI